MTAPTNGLEVFTISVIIAITITITGDSNIVDLHKFLDHSE
jgi:hypothetical protein